MPAPQESAICFAPRGLAASFASIGTSSRHQDLDEIPLDTAAGNFRTLTCEETTRHIPRHAI